ncbi:MAG: C2H2-type zinc finger protein [bacterium]
MKYKCKICNQEFENNSLLANHYRWKHKEKKGFKCEKCNRIFNDKSSYANHVKMCDGIGTRLDKRKERTQSLGLVCEKCNRKFNNRQASSQHIKFCDGNPIPKKKRKTIGPGKGWTRGRTFEEIYGEKKAKEIKEKISKSSISSWNKMPETKKLEHSNRARKNIQKRYEEGWDPKAGRCKKYKYRDFTVDGTWELEFCRWADEVELIYERNYDRFEYEFEGEIHKYKPDFKLSECLYVEVKGYQTNKDNAKWSQFEHDLIILKRSQIDRIKKRTFKKENLKKYYFKKGRVG